LKPKKQQIWQENTFMKTTCQFCSTDLADFFLRGLLKPKKQQIWQENTFIKLPAVLFETFLPM